MPSADLDAIKPLYPFRSHFFTIDGHRLHYLDEGSGPPILLLHGNPTWSFYYRELVREFSEHYRVIAPDHIGCGLSEKPQNYPYTLSRHIDNLGRLLDHLRLTDITLGVHDWGGAIGFGYAARHPQRIRRFIVFNTAAFIGPVPFRISICAWPIVGAFAVRGLNAFARAAIYMACKNRSRMTRQVKRGYLLPYRSYRSRVAVHQFVRDIPRQPNHPTRGLIESIDRSLAQFRDKPMIIFWGMKDFCFTEVFLNGWLERFPQAEVHHLPDAGHYVLEDAHDRIPPLLHDFLSRT